MPFLQNSTGNPVVGAIAYEEMKKKLTGVMNSTKRLIFGVVSTLLLAVGFVRAADRLDPMSQGLRATASDIVVADGGTPPCAAPCLGGGGADG